MKISFRVLGAFLFAVVVVAILAMAIVLTSDITSISQESVKPQMSPSTHQPQKDERNDQTGLTRQDLRGTESVPLVVRVLKSPKTAEEVAQNAEDRQERMANDRHASELGLLTIVVLALQLCAFAYQGWKLRQTVDAAADQSRKMGEYIAEAARAANAMEGVAKGITESAKAANDSVALARERSAIQMRAYLSVVIGNGLFQERDKNLKFEVRPVLVNTGHTPAHKMAYRAKTAIMPWPVPADFTFPLDETTRQGGVLLGPQQSIILNAFLDDFVADDEVETIKRGLDLQRRLVIWGTVSYEDAFQGTHMTNFCQTIHWVNGPQGEIIKGYYSFTHNDAT